MAIEKLKGRSVNIRANSYGALFINVSKKNTDGQLVHEATYKFDGFIDGVDLEISIPPKCRKEYAKIVAVK